MVAALTTVAVVFAGLLAGEEFVVRWGIAPAVRMLPDPTHLRVRIALVRRLRVLVPALIVPSVVLVVTDVVVVAPGAWGWAAVAVLAVFVAASAFGTVPLNMQVIDWDPDAPPATWRAVVARWEAIDVLRSTAAILTFVLLALAAIPS